MNLANSDRQFGSRPSEMEGDPRTVGELFGELANDTSSLIRQEVKLATIEVTQKISYAGRQAAYLATAGLIAFVSVLAFVTAIILALGMVMPIWAAALAVGALVGGIALMIGTKSYGALRELDPRPRQTLRSLKETKLWAQEQIR